MLGFTARLAAGTHTKALLQGRKLTGPGLSSWVMSLSLSASPHGLAAAVGVAVPGPAAAAAAAGAGGVGSCDVSPRIKHTCKRKSERAAPGPTASTGSGSTLAGWLALVAGGCAQRQQEQEQEEEPYGQAQANKPGRSRPHPPTPTTQRPKLA